MASRVVARRPRGKLRYVAGLDAAYSPDKKRCIAAAVLWDAGADEIVEQHVAVRNITFPYVPGLLSFREAPAVLAALRKLRRTPDGLLCDGHGYSHPRRFGLACHVGVICELPTIGCAKSLLVGEYQEPVATRGASTPLVDPKNGELIGSLLRTQDGVRPVFVSVGHCIDLKSAERVVLTCATRYRLPEPTRLADRLVAQAKRRL